VKQPSQEVEAGAVGPVEVEEVVVEAAQADLDF